MNPQQIAELIATGDPEQIKDAQRRLQALGYYEGAIDGAVGSGTMGAVQQLRDDQAAASERELAQQQAAAREAENDPTNQAIRFATDVGPYGVGAGAGYLGGRGARSFLNEADRRQGEMAQALARDESLTPESAKRGIDRMNRRRAIRNLGQFAAPAALFGTSEILQQWAQNPQTNEDLAGALNTVAAAERGAGTLMGAKQLMDAPKRFGQSPNDPVDIARIESRLQRSQQASPMSQVLASHEAAQAPAVDDATAARTRAGAPTGGETPEERVRHSERARRAASAAGIEGRSGLTKTESLEAVRKAVTENEQARTAVAKELNVKPGPKYLERISKALDDLGPRGAAVIAGMLGYDAIRGDAQADTDGEEGGASRGEALLGGAAAGGAAYGGIKGLEKGAEMAARYAPGLGRVLPVVGGAAGASDALHYLYTMPDDEAMALATSLADPFLGDDPLAMPRSERSPTPREIGPEQLQQLFRENRAVSPGPPRAENPELSDPRLQEVADAYGFDTGAPPPQTPPDPHAARRAMAERLLQSMYGAQNPR